MTAKLPLDGVQVVDFGQLTAGANTSAMLADLGADVIKVESAGYMDLFRHVGARDRTPGWWDRSPQFAFTNRNKRGVAVDMKSEEGRRVILELASRADVVVENFRRGVMERMGLGWETLSAANPRLVLASVSSQGETGPNRLHASFGSTLDATSGIASLTGYADGGPMVSGMDVNYPDQVASLFAAGVVVAALREARRTGRGAHLDLPQRELASFLVGEEIMAAAAGAPPTQRNGNAQAGTALQDCFRAADGRWVAVTAETEEQAAILPGAEGPPAVRLAAWIAERPAAEAVDVLRAHGAAAAESLDGLDLLRMPELWGGALLRDASGTLVKGMPYDLGEGAFAIRRPAPGLGEHTDEVLREMGLGADEIARLAELGVTRATPDA